MIDKAIWSMTPTLAVKLGSIITHYEEHLAPGGHPYDRQAAEALLKDAEVEEWFGRMRANALVPVKRRG